MVAYKLILFINLIVAFLLQKERQNNLPFFFYFLFISVVFECFIGPYFAFKFKNNAGVYNIFTIITFAYYSYIFGSKTFLGNRIPWLIGLIIILSLSNLICFQGWFKVNTLTYNFGMFFVFTLILMYFSNKLNAEEPYEFTIDPRFWLGVGILLFYSSSFPILLHLDELIHSRSPLIKPMYNLVKIGNLFLVMSYLFSIICYKFRMH